MSRLIKNLFYVAIALTISGVTACKEKTFSTGFSGSTPDDGTEAPTVSEIAPLALKLTTIYDDTTYENPLTFDVYGHTTTTTTQSTTCAATDADEIVDCTVTVPEARLFFSKILFQFARLQTQCKLLLFQPYYYRAASVDGFVPPGANSTDDLDCATDPTTACWGGAATELVPSFPDFTRLIYTADESSPDEPLSEELTLSSAWSKSPRSNGSNIWSANNMDPSKTASNYDYTGDGLGDSYIANSYVDYKFVCMEDWFDEQPYIINLYIDEEDEESGPVSNDFWSWKDLL